MQTYPKNGLYGLQWVCHSGGDSFGDGADHKDLQWWQLWAERRTWIFCVSSEEQTYPKGESFEFRWPQ